MTTPTASINELQNPFALSNQEERDQLSDEMISLRFLAQIDRIMTQESISKKELASRLKTSPSYVTQLFQGDKLINVRLLTKLKRALNVTIDVICHSQNPEPLSMVTSRALELSGTSRESISTSIFINVNVGMTISLGDNHEEYFSRNDALIQMTPDKETGAYSFDPNSINTFGYAE